MIALIEPDDGRPRRKRLNAASGAKAWCGSCRLTIIAEWSAVYGWRCPICKSTLSLPPDTLPPKQIGLI
jgi:hypothetical protein